MEVQEFSRSSSFCPQPFHSDNNNMASSDHFILEELFDFPNDDDPALFTDSIPGNSTDSSTPIDSNNSSNSFSTSGHPNLQTSNFSDDLSVPYDDIPELEWLSNFEEESFSNEHLQKLQLISGIKALNDDVSENREFQPQPMQLDLTPIAMSSSQEVSALHH